MSEELKFVECPECGEEPDSLRSLLASQAEKMRAMAVVVEAAKEVLAVRGNSWEESNLPAYMERPFATLVELLRALDATKEADRE
jgi:hypothetical protein